MVYSVTDQALGKKGKITNADNRSDFSAWPYGFKFLLSCSSVYIYSVCILENFRFGVQMQLQTIQQRFLIISLLLKYKSFCVKYHILYFYSLPNLLYSADEGGFLDFIVLILFYVGHRFFLK